MIIAFDGPDNVGKSTQIKLLRKYFKEVPFLIMDVDAPIGDSTKEKLHYGKEHSRRSFEAIRTLPFSQIHDRIHFTEYAYSFFRDGHELEEILDLEKEYKDIKNELLIITFIDEVNNISARDDGLSQFAKEDLENIHTLVQRFKNISEKSIFDNHIINIHEKDIETVQKEVINLVTNKFK